MPNPHWMQISVTVNSYMLFDVGEGAEGMTAGKNC